MKKKSKIIGYFVTGPSGPYKLGRDIEPEVDAKVLWFGCGDVAVFSDRESASYALNMTKQYRDIRKLPWPWIDESSVYRLYEADYE